MKNRKLIYSLYTFVLTLFVCTSSDSIGSIRIVPLSAMLLYFIYILISDLGNVVVAIKKTKYVLFFTLLIAFSMLRNNLPNITPSMTVFRVMSLLLFYLSTCHVIFILFRNNETRRILNLILVPFLVLAVINICFYFIGLSKDAIVAKDSSILMSLIGVSNFSRVNFYLVGGVNSYGSLNGVCIVIAIFSYLYDIHSRKFLYSAILIFMIVAFFTDSRGSLLFAIFSLGICHFFVRKSKFSLLNVLPYLAFLAPFIMFFIMPILAEIDFFSFLSRGDNDLATGNSRFLIWGLIVNDMLNHDSLSIFGFGDGGLYLTNSYKLISDLFSQYDDIIINSQNSIISIILDYGIAAFIIFFMILFKMINRIKLFWNFNIPLFIVISGVLFYLLLIGITEAVIGMYYQNAFVIFIYIFCLPFLVPIKVKTKQKLS